MSDPNRRRLAVLGSPIAHSLSPRLHAAAYGVLGLDWQYESAEVTREALADFIGGLDDTWRGLSLTMPLKRDVLPLLDRRHPLVVQTGSANTVLFESVGGERTITGFNTDVYGIVSAFQRSGHQTFGVVQVLGGGATAASAIAAAALLSAYTVHVSVRSPQKAAPLVELGAAQGIEVRVGTLADAAAFDERVDAVISTLPNGAGVDIPFDETTRSSAILFDVAYDPWPTPLATSWAAAGGTVIAGIEMLVLQALMQVRIFVSGDPQTALDDESTVLAAMRAEVGL